MNKSYKNLSVEEKASAVKHIRTEVLDIRFKDLSDGLAYPKGFESTLKKWEKGEAEIPEEDFNKIISFKPSKNYFTNEKEEKRFTFIDLFAGIGGIRLPFHNQGGKCLFSSEIDKFARSTYRVNYNETPHGDITKIKTEDIPKHDILLAGFPCQPFSNAGLRKGFQDSRGTLFFEIERILEGKDTPAFLLENVRNFMTHDNGNTMKTIVDILENKLNYEVHYKVLNAKDFGLPQNRARVYIIGFKKNLLTNLNLDFKFPEPIKAKTRLGDILEENVDEKYIISDKLYEGHLRRLESHKKKGNGFGFSLFNHESTYTSTLSKRYYKDGSEILIDRADGNPRKLTPRECARLQGFPEDFIIPISDTQAYMQFGNSVPVNVIKAISREMVNYMELQKMLK